MRLSTLRMSTSCSSWPNSSSRRCWMSIFSSTSCLSSRFSGRCAAMVSARRPASSMLVMDARISCGIFLLSLTYCSKDCISARRSASISLWASRGSSSATAVSAAAGSTVAVKYFSPSAMACTWARWRPSTSTFTVPSGNFSSCRMEATQPVPNMSSMAGSSWAAVFWATSMTERPASMAASSAAMLLARPTNSGITMCGNTTTSRRGSMGSSTLSGGR